jgi:hypothetical protein
MMRVDRAYTLAMQSEQLLTLVDYDPWPTSPLESDPAYFRTWQRVSVALHKAMQRWAFEFYFRDISRLEHRHEAYTMVIYSACRAFYGHSRTEFAWDASDPDMLGGALRSIGCPTQRALATIETRLRDAGLDELSRRYLPVWHQDILIAVKKRPRELVDLLARESKLINAVIDLGTQRSAKAAHRFAKASNAALRSMHGVDMRDLLPRVLNQVTVELSAHHPDSVDDSRDARILEDHDVFAARSPDHRIS